MPLKIHCYLIFLQDKYAQDNCICEILYCSIVKKKYTRSCCQMLLLTFLIQT